MASITVTGTATPLDAALGATLTLTAAPGEQGSYQWTLVDRPETSTATLTAADGEATDLLLDKPGSYLVHLVINGVDEATTLVASKLSIGATRIRPPARGETSEASAAGGWGREVQRALGATSEIANVAALAQTTPWKHAAHFITFENWALSGEEPIQMDGTDLEDPYRIILAAQSTASQNGIYDYVYDAEDGYTLTRSSDANTGALLAGAIVPVRLGDDGGNRAGSAWQVEQTSVTLGTTSVSWRSFAALVPTGSVEFVNDGGTRKLRWTVGVDVYEVELEASA